MSPEKKFLCKGIMTVIGGMLIHFTFGYFYTVANMTPYIYSYAKSRVDVNADIRLTIWLSAIALVMQGVMMPIGGLVCQKIGFRPVVGIACILHSGSVLLTYFSVINSYPAVIITYALLQGTGFGFGYSVVMSVTTAWFPKRRALIFGLVVGGFGLGALIFTPIQTSFINPDNIPTVNGIFVEDNLLDRVPKCFLLCGGILLGLQIIGFCLMQQRPSKKPGEEEEEEGDVKCEKEVEEKERLEKEVNLKPKDLIRRLDFYLLWLILLFAAIPITIIASAYKLFGQAYITDDRFLSAVATVSSAFNSGGRIVWGSIVDKVSFKLPLCILLSIWSAVLVTFPHLYHAGETALRVLYVIWVCLLWFNLSGVFTIMPSATATLFGQKNVATNYGVVYSAFSVGSLLCGIFQTFLPEQTYVVQFSACFALVFTGLIVTLWVTDSRMSPRINICQKLTEQCGRLRGRDQQSDDFRLPTAD